MIHNFMRMMRSLEVDRHDMLENEGHTDNYKSKFDNDFMIYIKFAR